MDAGVLLKNSVWQVTRPKTWPKVPSEMTFTSLVEIEACPRRWALRAAEYPDIWDKRGYPERFGHRGLAGSVVHQAVEIVLDGLATSGCRSAHDAKAIYVMKDLGGFSRILNKSIDMVLSRYDDNPRTDHSIGLARQRLMSQIPEMRTQAQRLIGRIHLEPRPSDQRDFGTRSAPTSSRTPLRNGTHVEVDLRAPSLEWRGRADLVNISSESCEIIDFKTGAPRDNHIMQLKFYALLWFRDNELNPSARTADKLTLSYLDQDVEVVPPSEEELDSLEGALRERTAAVSAILAAIPPMAIPKYDNCRFCQVRHLCDDYWEDSTQASLDFVDSDWLIDAELAIINRRGPTSWNGVLRVGRNLTSGMEVVLQASQRISNIGPGDTVRVLDVQAHESENEERPFATLTLGKIGELFVLPIPSSPKSEATGG